MAIIGIVAAAQNLAIGKDGKLPWHYAEDLKFFKQTTTGNAVVMGWKTFASIGKPLPNRLNIVLSRNNSSENPEILVLRSKQSVLNLAKFVKGDIFIIGGESIYREFSDIIEKWIVTEIPLHIESADAFLPEDFLKDFVVKEQKTLTENLSVKFYDRNC